MNWTTSANAMMSYFPCLTIQSRFVHFTAISIWEKMMLCNLYSEAFGIWRWHEPLHIYSHLCCFNELKHFGICNDGLFSLPTIQSLFRTLHYSLEKNAVQALCFSAIVLLYYGLMLDLALFVIFSGLTYAYCYFFPVAYYQGYKKGEAFAAYDNWQP